LEFQSAGVSLHQALKREPGAENFIVKDPDGNLLLFVGPADKSALAQSRIGRSASAGAISRRSRKRWRGNQRPYAKSRPSSVSSVSHPPTLPLSDSPNICNLAKGCYGVALEDDRALPNGDVPRGRESL
jgi:hypothetical protein